MQLKRLLKYLTSIILKKQKDSPLLVAIDGVDASGKTTLAKELSSQLKKSGRLVIQTSIDGFHNPKSIRYAQGENSPSGYYFDSFNYQALKESLLNPLVSTKLQYRTAVFDYRTDSKISSPIQTATKDSILVMEGIFLFRPQLIHYWDIKIFLDVDFKTTIKRVLKRTTEIEYIGNKQKILDKYQRRYIPGQQLYLKRVKPKEKADIVIDNNDFTNPTITKMNRNLLVAT